MRTATRDIKSTIAEALKAFGNGSLRSNATRLFNTLGYTSEKTIELTPNTPENFLHEIDQQKRLRKDNALFSRWKSVDFILQITGEEIKDGGNAQISFQFDLHKKIDNRIIESYLFLAIKLREGHYTRTDLSTITREINKLFPMPVLILFLNGETLTLSVINRRLHKRDKSKDVLEKVTLIKDIIFSNPHRAHIDILCDLSFERLYEKHRFSNFAALHDAWQKTLDSSELNKRFFGKVANWYFWAVQNVTFPKDAGEDEEIRNATGVIRLITRLIFVWFIKEKGLVPDDLFNKSKLDDILKFNNAKHSTYYKAILQNLFFATLNQEMNTPKKLDNRKFRNKTKKAGGRDQHYMIHNVYRYERYFKNPDEALKLFSTIPFLNGGLFECLDKPDKDDSKKILRIDGFSDHKNNELIVPDFLFFSEKQKVDLNESYGTKNKQYEVRGLIDIFERYKFTINENTPIEEEVALDPELLGKVFENLLAAYNPETGVTARKQTGSFYTPREIVDYMVGESLKASLSNLVAKKLDDSTIEDMRTGMDILFAYTEKEHAFNDEEVSKIVEAVSELKILDPACGSGAFPMGVLHKLVYILGKLDWDNTRWRELQKQRAIKETEEAYNMGNKEDRHQRLGEIEDAFDFNTSDYGRKLYLIENCIYGVDIQPIAVQIAKLRFFVSLVVDQNIDDTQENRGILPLPNLETKFVAANTLIGLEGPKQNKFPNLTIRALIEQKQNELSEVRRNHFIARTLKTKRKWRARDAELRAEVSDLLRKEEFPSETTKKLAYWDLYDQNASADFFDPDWMFNISDGFDVVIGNPPYVRQEKIKELKPALKDQYDCYTSVADLYVYFYERGFQALKAGGILTYISSNKYFRSGYGKKLRKFLTSRATVHQLIDFGDAPVFASIAYPSIIILCKGNGAGRTSGVPSNKLSALNWEPGPAIDEFPAIFEANSFLITQKDLGEDGWRLESPEALRLLDKLRKAGKPLGKYVSGRFYRGIVTGLNKVFVVDRFTRQRLIDKHKSSAEIIKPLLRGQDIKRWYLEPKDLWIIFTRRGTDINDFPAIKKYLEQFKQKLMPGAEGGRKPGSYKWFEIQDNIAYWKEFEKKKIVWGNLAREPKFSFANPGLYFNAPANIIVSESEYLLGILNSRITQHLVSQSAAERQGGFLEFKPMYISPLAIPEQPKGEKLSPLVNKILTAKRDDSSTKITVLEAELDARVAHLYELTEEEYSLILNETKPPDPFRVAALNFYRDIAKGVLK